MEALVNDTFQIEGNVNGSTKFLSFHNERNHYSRKTISPVIVTFESSIIPFIQKLNAFSSLEQGWDGYNAEKPDINAINAAKNFLMVNQQFALPFYFIAPGVNAEIMLEFKDGNKGAELYFNSNDSTELLLFDNDEVKFEGPLENNFEQLIQFFNE